MALAHGFNAPSAMLFDPSPTMAPGSTATRCPSPWQAGHMPCGLLNENAGGSRSGSDWPQGTHASRSA